jgi:hypothetical protein
MDWQSRKSYAPLLLLLSLGISGFWWGKYPSREQAFDACIEWAESGPYMTYIRDAGDKWVKDRVIARQCDYEDATNQVLGYENKNVINGTWKEDVNEGRYKVIKNFRY